MGFVFILIGNHLIEGIKNEEIKEKKEVLMKEGEELKSKIEEYSDLDGAETKKVLYNHPRIYEDAEMKVLDASKNLILQTRNTMKKNTRMEESVIDKAVKGKVVYEIKEEIKIALPIKKKEKISGFLYVESNLEDISIKIDKIKGILFLIFTITILVYVFLVLFLIEYVANPISKLMNGFRNIVRGKLYEKIKIRGKGELSQLCMNFNIMSTKLSQIEEQRREFVSNVSHELKTPLSSIKLLIGSLIYDKNEDKSIYKEFLKDVDGEIDRLNSIIDDLMILVDIDEHKLQLNLEITYLNYLIEYVVKRFTLKAKEKNIKINYIQQNNVQIKMDSLKVDRVITNMLDNSIKYSNENSQINIYLYTEEDDAVIKIQDEGIGILKEDMDRIFERFYRVDKARSRKTGGSGLGLSIAKQIINLHQGEIFVESEKKVGTTFYIKIPTDLT